MYYTVRCTEEQFLADYEPEFGFLLFSCIVYFVYFTNYFCVCIFVYLLTINFVRVLNRVSSKYRVFVYNNKFHCQLRKNCTYLLHSMHVQLQYILFILYMNLHIPVLFIPHFLNASADTVSYAVSDQNF